MVILFFPEKISKERRIYNFYELACIIFPLDDYKKTGVYRDEQTLFVNRSQMGGTAFL
jgi:hypothetical protein